MMAATRRADGSDGMEVETVRTGGCGCGAVRYEVRGEPIFVNNCHCRLCQQQTGSTSVVNAFFEASAIRQTAGETSRHAVKTGSGGEQSIVRCANCGTALWSFYPRMGELGAGLRVGTLDDPATLTPDAVIFTQSRMPWVELPAGIPQFETTYNALELLAPDKVARLKALIEQRAAQASAAG